MPVACLQPLPLCRRRRLGTVGAIHVSPYRGRLASRNFDLKKSISTSFQCILFGEESPDLLGYHMSRSRIAVANSGCRTPCANWSLGRSPSCASMPSSAVEDAQVGSNGSHGSDQLWAFESQYAATGAQNVVLGVDGGGTCTVCVCVAAPSLWLRGDAVPILSRVVTEPSNHNSVGEVAARRAIEESIAGALMKAQVMRSAVFSVCLAIAGIDRLSDMESYLPWIRKIFPHDVEIFVQNDAVAALASGTGGRLYGCVLVAGTGTIALGFDEEGKFARASGVGPALGDQGSGYAIASQALAAVMRAHDGRGPATSLTGAILKKLDLCSAEDLIGWVYSDSAWARVAALVPLVKDCAQAGDTVARQLLDDAVSELACSVKAVVQSLNLNGTDGKKKFPFVMVGGVLENENGWDLCKPLVKKVMEIFPGAQPIRPKVEPAIGAAMLAWSRYQESLSKDALETAGAVA